MIVECMTDYIKAKLEYSKSDVHESERVKNFLACLNEATSPFNFADLNNLQCGAVTDANMAYLVVRRNDNTMGVIRLEGNNLTVDGLWALKNTDIIKDGDLTTKCCKRRVPISVDEPCDATIVQALTISV